MPAPHTTINEGLFQFATPRQAEYLRAVVEHGSARAAARALGVNRNSINQAVAAVTRRAALQGFSPAHDMTRTVPEGFAVKGVSTYYNKDGKPSGQWVKSRRDDAQAERIMREFIEGLAEDIRGASPLPAGPAAPDEDLLAVYPMGDPHFGMYAWAAETGADFDTSIAERLTLGAIDRLVASAPAAKTAIVLPLGDFFHADDTTNRTPAHGNQLDVDSRWAKVMQIGLRALVHCVLRALERHETVIVRVVKGNHDIHASFGLALALDAYFSNNPRVKVDLSPSAFWFFQFGRVLIGSTHGDQAKVEQLPSVMAADRPAEWGSTRHRYWYVGHVHHKSVKEYPGVVCETFRTLAARDAWHDGKGYRAGRDMCLIVHHREHGEIERHRCDVGVLA